MPSQKFGGCVSFFSVEHTCTSSITVQEANKTFSHINEDLCKLETKVKADAAAAGKEEASLQLLRDDLRVQGDTLSSAILRLCADVRSSVELPQDCDPSAEVNATVTEMNSCRNKLQ